MSFQRNKPRHRSASLTIALLLVISPIFSTISWAEGLNDPPAASPIANGTVPSVVLSQIVRLVRIEVEGRAELITVFARLAVPESTTLDKWIPLVSLLRDTLGDKIVEN